MGNINLDMVILIVDDSHSMRRIVGQFLINAGFKNLIEAENGKKALEALEKSPVDLIVSDLNMPIMGGFEFLKRVKGDFRLKDIPFVILTVEAIQKTMNKALTMNVDSYIVKPITEKLFIAELKRVIQPENRPGF